MVPRWCTLTNAKRNVTILALIATISSGYTLAVYGFDFTVAYCIFNPTIFRIGAKIQFAFLTVIPTLIILSANLKIISVFHKRKTSSVEHEIAVRLSSQQLGNRSSGQVCKRRKKNIPRDKLERQITKRLLIISFAYLILSLPMFIRDTFDTIYYGSVYV